MPYPRRFKISRFPHVLVLTPAEWRAFLEDPAFLRDQDNSYRPPRKLMGVPVKIVPDHRVEFMTLAAAAG